MQGEAHATASPAKASNEELAVMAKGGDKTATHRLWEQTCRLIFSKQTKLYCRNQYAALSAGVTLEDVKQTSYFIVLQAVRLFDPARKSKFNTFLDYCIKNEFFTLIGMRTAKDRGEPLNHSSSLEEPVLEDDEELHLWVCLPDPAEPLEITVEDAALRAAIDEAFKGLSPRQLGVIKGRYYENKTLAACGESYGITRERTRQIEKAALKALKVRLEPYGWLDDIKAAKAYQGTGFGAWKARGSVEERIVEQQEQRANESPLYIH